MTAAIVAAIMSILELIELFTGFSFGGAVSPEWIEATLMVLTPLLVWLVPDWLEKR